MVNPRAKMYLEWSCIDGVETAVNCLKEKGVRIISSRDLKKPVGEDKIAFGLYEYRGDKKINLAMPIWNWGMSAGVVELVCSNHLPESVKN